MIDYNYNGARLGKNIPSQKIYKVTPLLEYNNEAINKAKSHKAKFIIATNQLDGSVIRYDKPLSTYKE